MNSADDNVKLDVVSEDNSQTKGEEKKDDSLKRIKCEIGKIPITVMRPRSMSGSRYLTDEVNSCAAVIDILFIVPLDMKGCICHLTYSRGHYASVTLQLK